MASREESRPLTDRRGCGVALIVTRACTSARSGRRPSNVTVTQVPAIGARCREMNKPGRVGNLDDPVGADVEAADLVHRPEPVLDRAQHPQPRAALALEAQHDVDEMLQRSRPGDRTVLGHVADQQRRHGPLLGDPDQRRGDGSELGDAPGRRVDVVASDGLHRVDHQQVGLNRLDVAQHGRQLHLGGEQQQVLEGAGALATKPDLGRRLLARDVEGAGATAGRLRGDLEQQRRLADARLPGEQQDAPGDDPSTEHPVELADAGRTARVGLGGDLRDRHCRCRDGSRAQPRLRNGATLLDRPPGLALAAPARPGKGLPAALGAPERRAGSLCRRTCHDKQARARLRHFAAGAAGRAGRPACGRLPLMPHGR